MIHTKIDLSNSDEEFVGRSSYRNEKFSKVLKTLCILKKPKKIVEFGILDGYSLDCFLDATDDSCIIEAYDLFEDFPYNSSKLDMIFPRYSKEKRVKIKKSDIFKSLDFFEDKTVDIFHIDIANNGETYEFCIQNFIPKLSNSGILVMEGGSEERDNCDWMVKYNKPKIRKVLDKYSQIYDIKVFNEFPSLTIIQNK
jgi:hypothetical protein